MFITIFIVLLFCLIGSVVELNKKNIHEYFKKVRIKRFEKQLDLYINKNCKNIIFSVQNMNRILHRFNKENKISKNAYSENLFKRGKGFSSHNNFFTYINRGIFSKTPLNKIFYNLFIDDYDKLISDLFVYFDGDKHSFIKRICQLYNIPYCGNKFGLKYYTDDICKKRKYFSTYKYYNFMDDFFNLVYYVDYYYFHWDMKNASNHKVNDLFNFIVHYIFYKHCDYFTFMKPDYDYFNYKIIKKLNKINN